MSGEASLPDMQPATFLLCPHTTSLLCEWRERGLWSFPPLRTPVLLDQGPTHMTSFNLNYLLKGPISQYSHTVELGFSISIGGRHRSVCDTLNNQILLLQLLSVAVTQQLHKTFGNHQNNLPWDEKWEMPPVFWKMGWTSNSTYPSTRGCLSFLQGGEKLNCFF